MLPMINTGVTIYATEQIMRKILTSLALGGVLLATSSLASAKNSRFYNNTIEALPTTSIRIDVELSEDLAYRANNLPKKLSDRSSARGLRSGFAGNGFYGDKDLNKLMADLEKWTARDLEKKGVEVDDNAQAVLKLTLVDARPNRPTFNQLSQQPGLDFRSFAVGGAEIEGELFAANGTSMGKVSYEFYETFFDGGLQQATAVWSDARRTMQRFSRRFSKDIAKNNDQTGS
jgi:hypothetical protein